MTGITGCKASLILVMVAASNTAIGYTLTDKCKSYVVSRDKVDRSKVIVSCTDQKRKYELVDFCKGKQVDFWQKGGKIWLWCKGDPKPQEAR